MTATRCLGIDSLPASCAALFAAERNFSLGRAWLRNMIANGLPPGTRALFSVLLRDREAAAILPLQSGAKGGLASLTNCYTCLFRPLIATGEHAGAIARRLGVEVGHLCAQQSLVRIDCLPPEWPALGAFVDGLSSAGLAIRRFDHFGNWYEPIGGRTWQDYLAARPGHLRELLRRRGRRMHRAGEVRFEIVATPEDLPRGIAAYEAVYRRSWKEPEPFPRFNAGLMQEAAREQALRLGICWRGETPIAAQLWIVAGSGATVMKLAHDEAHRALSPGTVLTAEMIARLLQEGIEEIDFGRGDDPYKRLWAGQRRQRVGLLIVNPRRLPGLLTLCRHDLGRMVGSLRRRVGVSRAWPMPPAVATGGQNRSLPRYRHGVDRLSPSPSEEFGTT
ncbi:MAG TPA: GNAT family N-acetyltransferase [Stellaceae bacterium]|nr:GNAT family N-acetyltransferase [Stellaceae bacterium]